MGVSKDEAAKCKVCGTSPTMKSPAGRITKYCSDKCVQSSKTAKEKAQYERARARQAKTGVLYAAGQK